MRDLRASACPGHVSDRRLRLMMSRESFLNKGRRAILLHRISFKRILNNFMCPGYASGPARGPIKTMYNIYRRSHYTCACVREPLEQTCMRPRRIGPHGPHATGAGININIQQQLTYTIIRTRVGKTPPRARISRDASSGRGHDEHRSKITTLHKILVRTS